MSRRFVTIVGPGGIGKTTVAVATGHALLAEFAGKVHFVDLGTIHHATLVPNFIASSLGLLSGSNDPLDGLAAFLRDRRMLVILDCCEPVIEMAASLAERLHNEAPQLHILTTSRESLRVDGEHIHRLAPLESPPDEAGLTAAHALTFPAVELFVERAGAGGGQFELSDANVHDVAEACRKLDGIALAIELAASRVSTYGVRNTIELLNKQFNLLWEGRRTALPRHRTMHATIDWSYHLLSDVERATLSRLSVFSGNFTLHAARSVAAAEDHGDAELMGALASLVTKSMLALNTGESATQYRLLDTTRAYAQEKLSASPDAEVTARRHASYFLNLLETIRDGPREDLLDIADQFGNIRAALSWCFSERGERAIGVALAAASMPLFLEFSLLSECQLWATRAIDALDGTSEDVRYDLALHAALGYAHLLQGKTDSAETCLVRALHLAEQTGDHPAQLRLIERLHLFNMRTGNFSKALDLARQGEAIASNDGDSIRKAHIQVALGISHHLAGDCSLARSYIEAALPELPASEPAASDRLSFDYHTRARITLARILWLQGYADQAADLNRQALLHASEVNHPVKLLMALIWASSVFVWRSDLEDYEECANRVIVEATKHSLGPYVALGQGALGVALLRKGEVEEGIALLRHTRDVMREYRYGFITEFSIALAEGLNTTGQQEEALDTIDRAICRIEHNGDLLGKSELLRVKAGILSSASVPDFAQAEAHLMDSLALARQQGALAWELRTATSLAKLRLGEGRGDEAGRLLAPVYARLTEGLDGHDAAAAREVLDRASSKTNCAYEIPASRRLAS